MMLDTYQDDSGDYVPVPAMPPSYPDVIRQARRDIVIELDPNTGEARTWPREDSRNG